MRKPPFRAPICQRAAEPLFERPRDDRESSSTLRVRLLLCAPADRPLRSQVALSQGAIDSSKVLWDKDSSELKVQKTTMGLPTHIWHRARPTASASTTSRFRRAMLLRINRQLRVFSSLALWFPTTAIVIISSFLCSPQQDCGKRRRTCGGRSVGRTLTTGLPSLSRENGGRGLPKDSPGLDFRTQILRKTAFAWFRGHFDKSPCRQPVKPTQFLS